MSCDSRVGLEAQKLINISLGKMAASRVGRSGASLHKSLLVASVLQRARHVILEESYNVHRATHPEAYPQPPATPPPPPPSAGAVYTSLLPPASSSSSMTVASTTTPSSSSLSVVPSVTPAPPTTAALPTEDNNSDSEDKENRMCEKLEQQQQQQGGRVPLTDHCGNSRAASLKRRRCVSQQETQEAVWSILPKRSRTVVEGRVVDVAADLRQESESCANSMEVEHITSLVSIFSFGGQRVDLCGAEAAREDMASYQPVALAV
ncbi:uncharacterized protein [Panulirus ornatus]|uniref:uncharacterized protein n=1 Tax=Panulirus ornatus TaxID=150431 RepID=UPI003A85CCFF